MNENIGRFVAKLLEERNYKITFYRGSCYFHATHKNDCWQNIEVYCEGENIVITHDLYFSSRGRDLKESIKIITEMYNRVEEDINFVKKQLLNINSKENQEKMLKICGVPEEVIKGVLK